MDPQRLRDLGSTVAGGGAGMGLLLTVRWETVPAGETVKIVVALILIWMGYRAYRGGPDSGTPA
jgi:hypothetical protein